MVKLVGREPEKEILSRMLDSPEAELIAVFGRRRVGKTFLIRSVFEKRMLFEFTGIHNASLNEQLQNFSLALKEATGIALQLAAPVNWIDAFYYLQTHLTSKLNSQKSVIFFDEFPWIHTPKSGFLAAFEHFWNTWACRQKNIVVVICGSAAAWMIRNIVNNKGGLHNRISQKIRLLPFNLRETADYLKARRVNLDQYQVLQLYMAIGGIPQYLKDIMPGESAAQAIDRLCFTKDGKLKGEFITLYQSLFDNADNHIAVIRALANKARGLNRNEIIAACGLSSGGTATRLLEELAESGFITPYIPFDKNVKESIYKLSDEYSLFYLKFMERTRSTGADTWLKITQGASWKSWSGFAFEGICLKHSGQIKKALSIGGVQTEESVWRYTPGKNERGAQIDLLIDRKDHSINICEMKYSVSTFTIDKAYAGELQNKINVFREKTKTKKTLFLTMITTFGVKENIHSTGLVQKEIMMEELFK
ncbi:MAG: ATP-binding protein [Ferruginibacter sp.]